ncbi:MAG: hypothetical protein IH945_07875 [Armatimonadetes bacterium]|nr:hypothetical protein [Armatimonadota bacterium]
MNISKTVLAVVVTLGLALFSSSDALAQGKSGGKGGGGGGGGGNLAVSVTFWDSLGDRLMSDNLGVYSGTSQIDQSGNLAFGFGAGRRNKPNLRKVFFDFRDCLSGCTPPLFDSTGGETFGNTYGNMYTSGVDLRGMAIDETRDDLVLYGSIKPNGTDNAFRYYFDPTDTSCPGSTFVSVTRTSPDTWEIEAGADAVLCLREGGKNAVQRGLYRMPFKMTLQAVPAPTASSS